MDLLKSVEPECSSKHEPDGDEELFNAPEIESSLRGVPKSGRKWKSVRNEKHSAIKRDKTMHTSWEKKKRLKNQLKTVKQIQAEITEARKEANLEKKRLREERQQRKLENEKKAEIVVKIKNVHKLKRMKKKQLRKIEKRADDD